MPEARQTHRVGRLAQEGLCLGLFSGAWSAGAGIGVAAPQTAAILVRWAMLRPIGRSWRRAEPVRDREAKAPERVQWRTWGEAPQDPVGGTRHGFEAVHADMMFV